MYFFSLNFDVSLGNSLSYVRYNQIYLKYSGRLACTNSVNPDQTAPEGDI